MARKNVLQGLMKGSDTPVEPPRYSGGAIGAVSQSIAELKARSIIEVDPKMIDSAGLKDRFDQDDLERLTQSIQDHGQQVPVLLRPNPNYPERYQIVYGRRRVAALLALGQPVKALVRDLDDRALVIAQGQENTARKDLSFIEKANFARQMRDAGYDRKIICDALHMDKTLISRLLSVADRIPIALIEAIGTAPSIGRDRWLALADKLKGRDLTEAALGETSDARFEAVFAALTAKPPARPKPEPIRNGDQEIAQISRKRSTTTVRLDRKSSQGFDDWLVENLAQIHRDWQRNRGA